MYKNYFKIGWRNLIKHKGYSLINIVGLAVGMGVCILIGQYIYFELSYDKFHENVQNTYRINRYEVKEGLEHPYASTTFAIGPTAKEIIPEILQYVRIHPQSGGATVTNPNTDQHFKEDANDMLYVDVTFFQIFDFPLKLGSTESVFAEKFNIVITEKAASKYFGTDNPIGRTLKVGGDLSPGIYTVSGVLEEVPIASHLQFDFLLPMENLLEYAVFGLLYKDSDGWDRSNFVTYLTLDEPADLKAVSEKLDQVIEKYRGQSNAGANIIEKVLLQPLVDVHLKSSSFTGASITTNAGDIKDIRTFSIIAVFILVIAWVNYINLSTSRSIDRAKEVGIRKTSGALKKQLIGQFMVESILVNLMAATIGVLIAFVTLPILSQLVGQKLELSVLHMPMFWLWFWVAIILGSILSGLYPAFVLSAYKPLNMLGSYKTTKTKGFNLRRGLITFQFLISMLLISATYLVYKQITYMKNKELGIAMEKILVLRGPEENLDMETLQAFRTEIARHHSISNVTGSGSVPGRGSNGNLGILKLGAQESTIQDGQRVFAGLGFPEVYDFEFLAGSSFNQYSNSEERVVIINEEAVRVFGLGSPENAIQQKLIRGINDTKTYTVIGVIKNFHWHSLKEGHTPYLFSLSRDEGGYFSIKMNMANIEQSIGHIENIYRSFFPANSFAYFFLEDEFNQQYLSDVQFGNLFLAFTTLAIFIACMGLFALVSFTLTLKTKEIGIRKVLGANIGNIMLLLSKDYLALLSIAAILAIPMILYGGQSWLDNYAFKTNLSIELFLIPCLAISLISVLTVSFRTYSAARSNPVNSLKSE